MEIKVLMRRGAGIREMARELRCSRNTVRRYLREAGAGRYGPRLARPTKLDPYKDYLLERIHAARPHWIPAVVLFREIKERGYPGGVTQLKEFLKLHRQQNWSRWFDSRRRPANRCRSTSLMFAAVAIPYWHLSPHWVTAGPAGFALPAMNVPIRCAPVLSGHLDILVAFPSMSCLIMPEQL